MRARVHVWISGEVQGVFFRSSIRSQATMKRLKGWVKNLMDGRVEAVFEGDKEKIDDVLVFCKEGPPGSRIDNLEVKWEKPTSSFNGFEIKY
jgi:acylphosphatase